MYFIVMPYVATQSTSLNSSLLQQTNSPLQTRLIQLETFNRTYGLKCFGTSDYKRSLFIVTWKTVMAADRTSQYLIILSHAVQQVTSHLKYHSDTLTLRRRTTYIYVALWRSLTLRRLMSYIYGAPILDVSRSHTTTQHSR